MSLVPVRRLEAIVLRVRNLDSSVLWYEQVLGLAPLHRDDSAGIAILALEGAPLTLWYDPEREDASTSDADATNDSAAQALERNVPQVASQLPKPPVESAGLQMGVDRSARWQAFPIFEVTDAGAAHAALLAAGLDVSPLHEDLKARWCEVADPDGNRLQLTEPVVF
jgi:catechol 2,3-dioxygenase-like lactoylglutathione lyase family enzyme